MRFMLEGSVITSREALHRALAEGLELPEWYGGNLDALHDCLTELDRPLELTVRGGAALEAALGGYAVALRRVLADCAAENGLLTVVWEA